MKKYYFSAIIVCFFLTSYGQNTFPVNGNVGIGTSTPGAWFSNEVTQFAGTRPTIRLSPNYDGGLGTILFKGAWSNTGGTADEFHLNYASSLTNPRILLSSYLNGPTNVITFMGNGNVGIGGEIPSAKLHVQADANTSGASENSQLVVGGLTHPEKRLSLAYNTSSNYAEIQSQMYAGAYSTITLNPNGGNVGIGTTTPDSKLSVNGKIRAKEIKVETANWPDYVFAKDYTLPPLAETEKHIKEKGHLPGIPSAADVKADGIDLGDMNARLLKKIEELTLHLIKQNLKISKQEEEDIKIKKTMNLLLSEIDVLKKKVK